MRITAALFTIALSVSAVSAQSPAGPRTGVDWPGFRGIKAGGVDDAKPLPVQWSAKDSKLVKWRVPVEGLGHSSPVGDVYVVKAGPVYELLATNPLGEVAMATPAISEGAMIFRTRNHLLAIGER